MCYNGHYIEITQLKGKTRWICSIFVLPLRNWNVTKPFDSFSMCIYISNTTANYFQESKNVNADFLSPSDHVLKSVISFSLFYIFDFSYIHEKPIKLPSSIHISPIIVIELPLEIFTLVISFGMTTVMSTTWGEAWWLSGLVTGRFRIRNPSRCVMYIEVLIIITQFHHNYERT